MYTEAMFTLLRRLACMTNFHRKQQETNNLDQFGIAPRKRSFA